MLPVAFLAGALAVAAEAPQQAPPPDLVIQVGSILPMSTPEVKAGAIVIRGGKIVAVVPKGAAPPGVKVLDFPTGLALPGMIDCSSRLFVPPAERREGEKVAPHFDIADALDPYDRARREVLAQGVTCVYVSPGSVGALGGLTAVVKLNGAELLDQLVVKRRVALKGSLGVSQDNTSSSVQRLADYVTIREELLATQRYLDEYEGYQRQLRKYEEATKKALEAKKDAGTAKPNAEKKPERPERPKRDPARGALVQVLRGAVPLQLEAHREDCLRNALRLQREFGLKLILEGATEAYRLADEIAAAHVPVIVAPVVRSFRLFPQLDLKNHTVENAATLSRTGLDVLLGTGGDTGKESQFLGVAVAEAIRGGLRREAALRAVTADAARVLGVEDRVGRLAPGCDADIVVFSGEPWAPDAVVQAVFIDGQLVYGGAQ
jgi:imidazolonepropionase-like amidohydrolase